MPEAAAGISILMILAIPDSVTDTTIAHASTCPETICPPKRPPACIALSRLTSSPGFIFPRELRYNVSGIASAVKQLPDNDVTVRQTPLTAMLSPSEVPSMTLRALTVICALLLPRQILFIVPVSSIIPVNISFRLFRFFASLRMTVLGQPERIIFCHPERSRKAE